MKAGAKQARRAPSGQDVKNRSDRLINWFLISYFVGGLLFASFYGTWMIAIGVGGLSLLAYYVTKIALPDSSLYQYVLSAVLAIFMAQYIYQMHGLFEMHFFAFIGSAILITYQNWRLQLPMMIIVVVHHAVFGYLQNAGYGNVYFTQLDYFNLQTLLIHILLAGIIFYICGLWAYQLKKYSKLQNTQARELERLQKRALIAVNTQKEQLERHVAVLDKAVAQGKYEMASDVMHDIGNAVVGFGSYLTRVKRLQDDDSQGNLQNLAGFFEEQQPVIATAIGDAKAGAVIKLLAGMAQTQRSNQEEIGKAITEQVSIIANIQEILHIQRRYIEGHESQERKPVNLHHIIRDTLAMLFASIDEMAIAVTVDIPVDLPPIKGDRTKLMQVMLHVLKNSIEAIGIQGEEKTISLRAHARAGLLELEVRDTGNGFDPQVGSQLFERGFSTKSSGAGQALYNCREILESHAGTMAITSLGTGKGALASIRFKV
jgi:two-component system, sensor histidine kinase and response regulator